MVPTKNQPKIRYALPKVDQNGQVMSQDGSLVATRCPKSATTGSPAVAANATVIADVTAVSMATAATAADTSTDTATAAAPVVTLQLRSNGGGGG